MGMKAISLTQPWGSLVAVGLKQFETRSWCTTYRGPIAIHAAKKLTWEAVELGVKLQTEGVIDFLENLPRGCVIAVAVLNRIWPARIIAERPGLHPQELRFGDFSAGRYAWELTDVKILERTIPCTGRLGLFELPPVVLSQVLCSRRAVPTATEWEPPLRTEASG